MKRRKYRPLAAAAALALSAVPAAAFADAAPNTNDAGKIAVHTASAYAPDEIPEYELEEVVVTASGFEEQLRIAPASISIIKADEIEKRGYTDLRQVLDTIEGVDVFGGTGAL